MERFANMYDECYCPSCHSRENSPNNPHLRFNGEEEEGNMVCLNCGWVGHVTELTSLERLKNIKRTDLIDKMLK